MNETPTSDPYEAKLHARAAAIANRASRSIGVLVDLDEAVLVQVFERTPAQVAEANVYALFGTAPQSPEIPKAVDRCFQNMLRMAAALRKQTSVNQALDAKSTLLLDDLQILHREVAVLQKFLLAHDPLTVLARAAYNERFLNAVPVSSEELQTLDKGGQVPDSTVSKEIPRTDEQRDPGFDDGPSEGPTDSSGNQLAESEPQAPDYDENEYDLSLVMTDDDDKPDAGPPAADLTATAEPSAADESPAPPETHPNHKVLVSCPHCGQRSKAARRLVGTRVDCPKCKQQIVVAEATTSPRARSTVPTAPAANAKTRVACIHCGQQFLAPQDLLGRSVICTSCGRAFVVPAPAVEELGLSEYDTDPFATFDALGDYMSAVDLQNPAPVNSSHPATPPRARANRSRAADEEVPKWIWYAMAGALGLCVLVFLAILISSLLSSGDASQPPAEPVEVSRGSDLTAAAGLGSLQCPDDDRGSTSGSGIDGDSAAFTVVCARAALHTGVPVDDASLAVDNCKYAMRAYRDTHAAAVAPLFIQAQSDHVGQISKLWHGFPSPFSYESSDYPQCCTQDAGDCLQRHGAPHLPADAGHRGVRAGTRIVHERKAGDGRQQQRPRGQVKPT